MVEDRIDALFLAVEGAGGQDGLEHLLRGGGVLDDGALGGQVALQDCDGTVGADGLVVGADDVFFCQMNTAGCICLVKPFLAALIEAVCPELLKVLAERFAGDGHDIKMKDVLYLLHDRRNAACIVEEFCRPAARRAEIKQVVGAAVQAVEGLAGDFNAVLVGDRREMQQAVGRAGDGGVDHDCIFKALEGHDVLRPHAVHGRKFYGLLS